MSDTIGLDADDLGPTTTPHNYRKRPVTIQAVQLTKPSLPQQIDQVLSWMAWNNCPACKPESGGGGITIATLEGVMIASPGDWIIKGVQGEFYPCKPDIFAQTYERVMG